MIEKLYECHVTIEPVFDDQLSIAKVIASKHGFRIADLLMKKRTQDTPERSANDTFMTGYNTDYDAMVSSMRGLIIDLQSVQFKVWRYKIEDIILDSRTQDTLNLLG
jgi:hypothetical protein